MTEPVDFTATSPRHAFPFLVAGQAQKEFLVNEALARIDALLHPVVDGELAEPPTGAQPGQCWLVADGAAGDWAGREGAIASWDGYQWTYCAPHPGMVVYDASAGQRIVFGTTWQRAARPEDPVGGTVVDVEARAAIAALIDLFVTLAIIPAE